MCRPITGNSPHLMLKMPAHIQFYVARLRNKHWIVFKENDNYPLPWLVALYIICLLIAGIIATRIAQNVALSIISLTPWIEWTLSQKTIKRQTCIEKLSESDSTWWHIKHKAGWFTITQHTHAHMQSCTMSSSGISLYCGRKAIWHGKNIEKAHVQRGGSMRKLCEDTHILYNKDIWLNFHKSAVKWEESITYSVSTHWGQERSLLARCAALMQYASDSSGFTTRS